MYWLRLLVFSLGSILLNKCQYCSVSIRILNKKVVSWIHSICQFVLVGSPVLPITIIRKLTYLILYSNKFLRITYLVMLSQFLYLPLQASCSSCRPTFQLFIFSIVVRINYSNFYMRTLNREVFVVINSSPLHTFMYDFSKFMAVRVGTFSTNYYWICIPSGNSQKLIPCQQILYLYLVESFSSPKLAHEQILIPDSDNWQTNVSVIRPASKVVSGIN